MTLKHGGKKKNDGLKVSCIFVEKAVNVFFLKCKTSLSHSYLTQHEYAEVAGSTYEFGMYDHPRKT